MGQTLAQIVTQIKADTHKPALTDDEVVAYLNDGLGLLLTDGNFEFTSITHNSTLSFTAGDYRKELPAGFLDFENHKAVYDETNARFLTIMDWESFRNNIAYVVPNTTAPATANRGKPSTCAVNTEFDTTQKKYLYIDPPTDANVVIRLSYYRQPTELVYTTHSATDIQALWGVNRGFIMAIKSYVKWQIHKYKGSDTTIINDAGIEWNTNKMIVFRESDRDAGFTRFPRINLGTQPRRAQR